MNINYEMKNFLNKLALVSLDNCHDKLAGMLFKILATVFKDERTLCNYATFLYRCCWHPEFSKKSMRKIFNLYKESIRIDLTNTNAYAMMGNLYWECQDYKRAENCYQKAIIYLPDEEAGFVFWNLGITQIYLQYYEKAYHVLRKFLKTYPDLIERKLSYENFYSVIIYCLYRLKGNERYKRRISLNCKEFKEKVPVVLEPVSLIVYYMLGDYKTICENVELVKQDWAISKYLFLLVMSSLLEENKIEETNAFYNYCKENECEKIHVYNKNYFRLLVNKNSELIKDEIITGFIRDDVIQNGIISFDLFYRELNYNLSF